MLNVESQTDRNRDGVALTRVTFMARDEIFSTRHEPQSSYSEFNELSIGFS